MCPCFVYVAMICTLPIGGIEEISHILALFYMCLLAYTHTFCPYFECVDAKIALALIYLCALFHTQFTLVFSLQMPGHIYVCRCGEGVCAFVNVVCCLFVLSLFWIKLFQYISIGLPRGPDLNKHIYKISRENF